MKEHKSKQSSRGEGGTKTEDRRKKDAETKGVKILKRERSANSKFIILLTIGMDRISWLPDIRP